MEVLNPHELSVKEYDALSNIKAYRDEFDKFPSDTNLILKPGAQVILTKNFNVPKGIVNGSRGIVVGFQEKDEGTRLPVVRFLTANKNGENEYEEYAVGYADFSLELNQGKTILRRRQLPLRLGWALTVHKSQGMSLNRLEINLPVAFSPGQAYVAFSRVRTLNGLFVRKFNPGAVFACKRVHEFYENLKTNPNRLHLTPQASLAQ